MTEVEQPSQNGIDVTLEEDEHNKSRPADIEADMREMERRKRVEAIMNSRLFREELERIVDAHRDGGASGILQQLSDIVGVPASRVGSVFKSSNCVLPINDIRGIESMGYGKGEKILRCKLAATFRLLDLYGWTQGLGAQITARLNADQELFLVNPFGLLFHEVTASSLNKADMQGFIVEHGTTNFGINSNQYILHSVVHAARPDLRCVIYVGCNPVVAVSSLKAGILPLTKDSAVLGEIATHAYIGSVNEPEERQKLVRSLGPISKVLLLSNHGALCCGETVEEAFYAAYHIVQACETQLKLLPVGLDNLVLLPEEARKAIYDASRKPPEGFEPQKNADGQQQDNKERPHLQKPKWRVGGAEFEALMRMLDNAGFRTGYIYRHPLVKSELPKPKNDIEVPPAVSSLGYLLEEEELYRQGVWKKSDLRKGGDRIRWLNSPNVYQKVEVLETGTPDPKKITKWVADGSPTHSTPVRIENPMQFVPPGTNPKEFKKLQQLIKDNRRADKISAGPQSHILEGVTWDEANNRIKDATVSATGDHVVLMGAASKGIIQRGYQHNATVYKTPYAKNPFDSVTDDELNEYKKTVERKRVHGEYTDTDFSESEALSSQLTSGAQQKSSAFNAPSQSETEDASEPQVLRIETKHAPKPSQPEVVLSDATVDFLNTERAHSTSKKPPTGRDIKSISINSDDNLSIACSSTKCLKDFESHRNEMKPEEFYDCNPNNRHDKNNNVDLSDGLYTLESNSDPAHYHSVENEFSSYESIPEAVVDFFRHLNRNEYDSDEHVYEESSSELVYDTAQYSSLKQSEYGSNYSESGYIVLPYRTVSHFGFNTPTYARPVHKHIPVGTNKYIPTKRDMSFFDLFSSSRYAEIPEINFYQILKRKAFAYFRQREELYDLSKMTLKRKNDILSDQPNPKVVSPSDLLNGKRLKLAVPTSSESFDTVEKECPKMKMLLDPISEERESSLSSGGSPRINQNLLVKPGQFHEQINKFNYSDESPCTTALTEVVAVDSNITISDLPCSQHQLAADLISCDKQRNLMSRDERDSRKKEFFEIWEDHIQGYSSQWEQNSDELMSTVEFEVCEPVVLMTEKESTENEQFERDVVEDENEEEQIPFDKTESEVNSAEPKNDSSKGTFVISVSDETSSSNNQKDDNCTHSLNSIEKLILWKLENSELDRSQGTIFNKIETSIRMKLSSMADKKQRPSTAPDRLSSSTPTSDERNSDVNSFCSLNLSDIKSSSENVLNKPETNSEKSSSADYVTISSSCTSNDQEKRTTTSSSPSTKFVTRNISNVHISTYSKAYNKNRFSSNLKSSKFAGSPNSIKIKRNFISENILNVSMRNKQRKQNLSSIFGKNPFGSNPNDTTKTPEQQRLKISIQQNNVLNAVDNQEMVYSFQTCQSINGSPRLWVSVLPGTSSKADSKLVQKSKSSSRLKRTKPPNQLPNEPIASNSGVNNELKQLSTITKKLNDAVNTHGQNITNFGEQVDQIAEKFQEAVTIHDNIENIRSELRQNIIDQQNHASAIHSLMGEDD